MSNRSTARPNQASAVHGLKCPDLVDAMGRLHRPRCHILDLVTPTRGRVLFGSAVTISYFPSCSAALDPERYNLASLFSLRAAGVAPGRHKCSVHLHAPWLRRQEDDDSIGAALIEVGAVPSAPTRRRTCRRSM